MVAGSYGVGSPGVKRALKGGRHVAAIEGRNVTLVIPMFNERENIEHAIACAIAALERHAGSFEIVVVDDASTDDSAAIVERLCEREPRLRLLRHERNR